MSRACVRSCPFCGKDGGDKGDIEYFRRLTVHTLRRDTHTHASSQVNEKVIRAFVVAVMVAVAIETPFLKIKSQMCFLHFLHSSVTVKKDVLKCLYC